MDWLKCQAALAALERYAGNAAISSCEPLSCHTSQDCNHAILISRVPTKQRGLAVIGQLDDLHRTVRAGYQRAMKKGLGDEKAFDELMPLVRAYWPNMSPDDLRKQIALMIAMEPLPLG